MMDAFPDERELRLMLRHLTRQWVPAGREQADDTNDLY
jgi:hypothetical protein